MCARCKLQFGEHLIKQIAQNAANLISAANDSLQNLITKQFFDEATSKDLLHIQKLICDTRNASNNLINAHQTSDNLIKVQSDEIFLINESLREPLLNMANKLLGRQRLNFDQLTPTEQKLWNDFEKSEIYEFLTGEKDTVAEFCSNWHTFSAKPKVNIDIGKIAAKITPVHVPPQQPAIRGFSASAPSSPLRSLRDRKQKINYRALHLGQTIKKDIQQAAQEVKQKCKQMKKSSENPRRPLSQNWRQGLFHQSSNPLLPHLSL
jgi:hypothetical protein